MKDAWATNPRVCILSPCYNHGRYVPEMLESIFAQTFTDYEVVIVNDGSTDDSVETLEAIRDGRVRVFHTENQGPSAARNRGIRESRAPIVFNLDADDRIAPTFLEKAHAIFEMFPNAGIVNAEVQFFGAKTGRFALESYSLEKMLWDNLIPSTAMFRRSDWERVGGYCTDFVYGLEDYDFWLSIIELGRDVVKIPEDLIYYRKYHKHEESRSGRLLRSRKKQMGALSLLFQRHRRLYAREPAAFQRMRRVVETWQNENIVTGTLRDIKHCIRYMIKQYENDSFFHCHCDL